MGDWQVVVAWMVWLLLLCFIVLLVLEKFFQGRISSQCCRIDVDWGRGWMGWCVWMRRLFPDHRTWVEDHLLEGLFLGLITICIFILTFFIWVGMVNWANKILTLNDWFLFLFLFLDFISILTDGVALLLDEIINIGFERFIADKFINRVLFLLHLKNILKKKKC